MSEKDKQKKQLLERIENQRDRPKNLDILYHDIRLLKRKIKLVTENDIQEYGDDPEVRKTARQKAIRQALQSKGGLEEYIKDEYPEDYKTITKKESNIHKTFPRKWFIEWCGSEFFDRYRYIGPMLNFFYNRNYRFVFEEHKIYFDGMVRRARSIIGDQKYSRCEYSSFLVDKKLYRAASIYCGCKLPTAKKYINAFIKVGIIETLGYQPRKGRGKKIRLCADGYFNNRRMKIMFIKKDDSWKNGLCKYECALDRLKEYL